ncbi:MAG: molybdopterin-synthase adenylyltransferase MoeB [Acidobacteriota bacterium]|jgi:molybdopterin/thiamine biosynthesis adenylyltransferase
MSDARLSAEQTERYQAHLTLPQIGVAGQARMLATRALLVGVGGLGCPAAQYLAAAGIGTLGLLDDDIVDRSNLQRQILYTTEDLGRAKAEAAAQRLAPLNPDVELVPIVERLSASNVTRLIEGWDLVIDGSDNFATRYVVNDACVLAGAPLVTGSIYQFEGQVTVVRSPVGPCYRCLFPAPPPEQAPCREAGVLASLPGVVGTILATEALKIAIGTDASLIGRLLIIDLRDSSFRSVRTRRDPRCPLCGDAPSIDRPTAVAVCRADVG